MNQTCLGAICIANVFVQSDSSGCIELDMYYGKKNQTSKEKKVARNIVLEDKILLYPYLLSIYAFS